VSNRITSKEISHLKELHSKSTDVVAWYQKGSVICGPYNRHFYASTVPDPYQHCVSAATDDAAYGAAAMTLVPKLIEYIEFLEGELAVEEALRGK
jgi:hypothetical protein